VKVETEVGETEKELLEGRRRRLWENGNGNGERKWRMEMM
jgi:hypothetical protein